MEMAGCGHGARPATLTRGILRGKQTQACHQFSGVLAAGEVAEVGPQGDGHGERHAAQGLKRVDPRAQAPRCDRCLACLFETLEACGVLVEGADTCLKDDVLSRGGTDDR
jgi:hypothetical protein